MLDILYESRRMIAVKKPPTLSVAPDPTGGEDLMSLLASELRLRGVSDTLYLIHRLDRTVGGAVVFARTKEAAAQLSLAFRERLLSKEYLAVVHGRVEEGAALTHYLTKVGGMAKVVSGNVRGAKEARLTYRPLAILEEAGRPYTLLAVTLQTGRFHQIRAQLSAIGHPIVGDGKYGSHEKRSRTALFSHHLCLTLGEELLDVTALPDFTAFPWCMFSDIFEEKSSL